MLAAVVIRHDFDVFVTVASIQLVFDAEIWEMNRLVEIRQIVLVRPFLDLARVAIGPPVAVRSTAIPFLQKALVLALEVVLEDHAPDVGALLAEAPLVAVPRVLSRLRIGRWATTQLNPVDLDLTDVVIAIPWIAPSWIVIKHRRLLPARGLAGLDTNKRTVRGDCSGGYPREAGAAP